MSSSRRAAVAAALLVLSGAGCTRSRDLALCAALGGTSSPDCAAGSGEHPAGWGDTSNQESPSFHGSWIKATLASPPRADQTPYDQTLGTCQQCHGSDYAGGGVGVSCTSANCHTQPGGPEFCGTCHGTRNPPFPANPALPASGAHALHQSFCTDCHDVPTSVAHADHLTGKPPRVTFSGLALAGGKAPSYDAASKTCANVYCHAAQTPAWEAPPATIACTLCHQAPPVSHQAWARVATPPAGASPAVVAAVCNACHLVPTPGAQPAPGDSHVNGSIDFASSIACDTCHGRDATGAPPVSLDGSTDPSARGVGAHQAHLQETFPGRIGRAVACATCHTVPASVMDPGHLDHPLPATVSLPQNGTYDAATQTCNVWCHWGANAGVDSAGGVQLPRWTDTSGAVLSSTCTSCHGFPPLALRDGTPHTHAPPVLSACQKCHPFSVPTHVDGVVELLP